MKRISMLVTLVALVLLLVNPVLASTPGELVIWVDGERAPVLTEVAGTFTQEYGIPVVVQEMPFGDIRDNLGVVAPVGEGPDIIIGAHDWIGQLVTSGLLEPVDIANEEFFLESALDVFSWGEDRYGLPYAIESIGLFYNKTLVGPTPPTSFEELISISKGLPNGVWGLVLPQPDPYHTFPLFSAKGGYIFGESADGFLDPLDIGLNNEGAIAGLELFARLLNERVLPRAIDYQTMMSLFNSNQAAFMITGPWAFGDVRAAGVDYGFTQIPAIDGYPGRPFVGAQAFMISAFSENKMLANIFLNDFVANVDTMLAMFARDPRPMTFIPAAELIEDADIQGVVEAASQGVPMPAIPEMGAVWESWSDALELIINEQGTPKEALDAAVNRIRATILESR